MEATQEFPIGGRRQDVYDALISRGFVMSNHSDKHWSRSRDAIDAHIYGAGSRLRVYQWRWREQYEIADLPMAEAFAVIDAMDARATAASAGATP
jgi:hypothetical protein